MKIFASFLLLLLCNVTQAATPCHVGKVIDIRGQASLLREAAPNASLQKGMAVCQGDRFTTGVQGILRLRLVDGTLITVGKSSDFSLSQYRLDKKLPNIATFDLLKGAFRMVTGAISQRAHRVEIKTAVATIGVRGTDFWGGFGLSPDGALDVVMLDGKGVYVSNAHGKVLLDVPGQGTTVQADGRLGAVKHWPQQKVSRALVTITP